MATVNLKNAELWCENWRTLYKQLFGVTQDTEVFRGFRIPIADIEMLAAFADGHAVRGYIAIKDLENPVPEILLVPVKHTTGAPPDDPGQDVIFKDEPGDPDRTYIYDFTRPCPMQCDTRSPLYALLSDQEKGK